MSTAAPERTSRRRFNLDEDTPTKHSEMTAWLRGWHRRLRAQAYTLEIAAAEIKGRLSRAKGVERMAAAIKARKVTIRITIAGKLTEAAATQITKAAATYEREFGEFFPGRQRKSGSRGGWRFDQ